MLLVCALAATAVWVCQCAHRWCLDLPAQHVDELVSQVMRCVLFRHYKDGGPVGRADLNAVVYKHYPGKRSLAPAVVALAQCRFLSALGLHLKEVVKVKRGADVADVKKRVASALDGDAGTKVFVLRSALPLALRAGVVDAGLPVAAGRGLTMTVLALIHLAGEGGLAEETLYGHLAQLGVSVAGGHKHPQLGDVAELMAGLVKQRYIQRTKAPGPSGERWMLELAENGLDEVGTNRLDAWVAHLAAGRAGAGAAAAGGDSDDDVIIA